MNRTIGIVIALACVVVLALPSAALAQTASEGGYGDDAAVLGQVQDPNGGGGNTASGGSLPFTGAELGVLAGAGAALLLVGFGLRRMTHSPRAVS